MRRYTITVNATPYVIDVRAVDADTYQVRLDGRDIDVHLQDEEDLSRASISPSLEVSEGHAEHPTAPPPSATPRPVLAPTSPSVPPAASAPATGAPAPAGAGTLTAPMPGVVLTVEVSPGARVARGDTLLVLEAMKMKNALRAPRDAVVAQVLVSEGQQVRYADPLVAFEDA